MELLAITIGVLFCFAYGGKMIYDMIVNYDYEIRVGGRTRGSKIDLEDKYGSKTAAIIKWSFSIFWILLGLAGIVFNIIF